MAFKCQRWTLANILPVVFVIWIISTIWVLHVMFHLMHLIGSEGAELRQQGITEAIISQSLTAMLLLCFMRTVFTDPGSVPDSPEWSSRGQMGSKMKFGLAGQTLPEEDTSAKASSHELKQSGERRFCKWCDQFKPDRCHHCRVCRSCILRMDHHCPWIANCVGFRNHKYFFLLVLYSLLTTSFVIFTMWSSVMRAANDEMAASDRFLIVFGMTLAVMIGTLLFIFFLIHVVLMLRAQTTIEFCEKRSKKGGTVGYDRGVYGNITANLGSNVLLWFLPLSPPEGSGTDFDVVYSSKPMDAKDDPLLQAAGSAPRFQGEPRAEGAEGEADEPEVTGARAAAA